ncbi:MAG: TerC family protein [Saprospiraceae bacterium]
MIELLENILGTDWQTAGLIVLNLIIIESLLSVDNAAVLATMVMDLPPKQRKKALKYGIFGAYFFRGVCLLFATWLIKIWWLKPLGGLYLLWLFVDYWRGRSTRDTSDDTLNKSDKWFYRMTVGWMGQFWSTVVAVEIMDLAFSIDNVFAAVAFTDNIWLICTGVFIGILAMRFVAQAFVKLMERYPFLETAAFIVIGILGLKLTISVWSHFAPGSAFAHWLESEHTDLLVSVLTASCFVVPIVTSALFNFPHRSRRVE